MMGQYTNQFNSDVIKDLENIDKKLEETENKEEILKLRMAKLYRGMELTSGYNNRYNRF